MDILITKNTQDAADKVYEMIKDGIKKEEIKTLGLATGQTPLKLYQKMRTAQIDTSNIITFNLDEYVGLAQNDPNSFYFFMEEQLFSYLIFKENYLLNGMADDLEQECRRYDQLLEKYNVDFQILGIGSNGHIGFNEPGTSFEKKTHVTELTEETKAANKAFFEDHEKVPEKAITMGISSIMEAKKIVLLAFGKSKSTAVKQMLEGPISEECPASILQKHPNVLFVLDQEAACQLTKK